MKNISFKTILTIVLLLGAYLICQAIADVGATKMIVVANVVMPGGTLIFALTFTLRDMLHKRLGKQWAQAAIITAGLMNILQAGYLLLIAKIPAPNFFVNGDAWDTIFAIVPAITLGSIAAEVVSELIDTEIYHYWTNRFNHWPQWTRVLISNVVSLPIDSLVFGLLAFVILPPLFGAESTSVSIALSLVSGQIIYKAIITVISMPGIYLVKDKSLFE